MEALTWDLILKSNQLHLSYRAVYYLYDMQIMYTIFNFYNARTVRNLLQEESWHSRLQSEKNEREENKIRKIKLWSHDFLEISF